MRAHIHTDVIVLSLILSDSSHVARMYHYLQARTVPGDKDVSSQGAPDPVFPLNPAAFRAQCRSVASAAAGGPPQRGL